MSPAPRSDKILQQALDLVAKYGTISEAARHSRIPQMTIRNRMDEAKDKGFKPTVGVEDMTTVDGLRANIKRLQSDLAAEQKKNVERAEIRRAILGLSDEVAQTAPPAWVLKEPKRGSSPGVPSLFLSDLHWGEVVHPSQINNVNRYNMTIAKQRLHNVIERAAHLLRIISPAMDYPGIVLALGGDMISGNIHEELAKSNELETMPTVVDLYGELVGVIETAAGTFGKVFVPCVTGNHGRDTHKIQSKDRNATSFDWLLYTFLAKHFEKDKRVTFLIPDGPDAFYKIYNHRYLLTHGDQFRGGDGMIGALGPIIRGDHKKRSRNAQIDMEYDTMLLGHWHQYIQLIRLIVNGSLKGYDEYAYGNNFGFEPPQQALWLTHPKYGITYRMPVYADVVREKPKTSWVSVPA